MRNYRLRGVKIIQLHVPEQEKKSLCMIDTLRMLLYPTPSIDPFSSKVANKAIQMLICATCIWSRSRTHCISIAVENAWITSCHSWEDKKLCPCSHQAFQLWFFTSFHRKEKRKQKASPPGAVSNNLWTVDFTWKLHLVALGWDSGTQKWVRLTEVW